MKEVQARLHRALADPTVPLATITELLVAPANASAKSSGAKGKASKGKAKEIELADPTFVDESDAGTGESPLIIAAKAGRADAVLLLLELGAPWNALDKLGKCAGDYALENQDEQCVNILIEAGIQAELRLSAPIPVEDDAPSNSEYLASKIEYKGDDKLLDEAQQGVMMSWEAPLMETHAHLICGKGNGDVLNVGFGMGIIDEAIQRRNPRTHTIIEAHPDVYRRMLALGWDKRPGVRILFGRWQQMVRKLEEEGTTFTGIMFDTFGENYDDMRLFHQHLPKLLRKSQNESSASSSASSSISGSSSTSSSLSSSTSSATPEAKAGEQSEIIPTYTFFNGLGARNAFFHVVYCQIAKTHLEELGFELEYVTLPVAPQVHAKDTWDGVESRYWQLDTYYLPVVQFASSDLQGENAADASS